LRGRSAEHDDASGEFERFVDVVRDENRRCTARRDDLRECRAQFKAFERIERCKRLIEQDDLRRADERTR